MACPWEANNSLTDSRSKRHSQKEENPKMKGLMILVCVALSACEHTYPVPYPYVSYIPEMGNRSAVEIVPISEPAWGRCEEPPSGKGY